MSYLVMECHPGYVVLLDEEGRFLKAANLCYELGQTVHDPVLMKAKAGRQRHTVRWISSGIAAIAACFLFFFGFRYYQNYLQPYSSIYLTINPEVQMDLNRQGTVVGLAGTNTDGEKLLAGYDGKGKDNVTVASELLDRAIEMGFLSEGGVISFSIDSPDDALFQEYGMALRTKITEHLDGRIMVTIEVLNHRDGQNAIAPETSSPVPPSSESAQPAVTPPAVSGPTNYDDTDYGSSSAGHTSPSSSPPAPADTDYGSHGDGVTGYTPPSSSPPAPADTDYDPDSDGSTDYTDGNTDYDPDNGEDEDDDKDD